MEEHRALLLDILELRRKLAESGGLIQLIRQTPDAEPYQQAVVCHAFRSLAALGAVNENDAEILVSDSDWVRGAVTKLEPGPLQGLLWGLFEIQRKESGHWHWVLAHLLSSLAEELDVTPERRKLLAYAAVRTAAMGRGMSLIRKLATGRHREELAPLIDEWRNQFIVVRTLAPPVAAAFLRGVIAGLAR